MHRGILRVTLALGMIIGISMPAAADQIGAEDVIVGAAPAPIEIVNVAEPAVDRSGPFIGLGINYFMEEFPKLGQDSELRDIDTAYEDSWGFNLRGGYRFNDYFAAEGVLEYADGYSSDISFDAIGAPGETDTVSDTRWSIDIALNAKAILPLGRFEPYVSGGIGFLYMNSLTIEELWIPGQEKFSQSDDPVVFMGRVAAGMDYALNDTFGLFAEAAYLMPTSTLENFNAISISLGGRMTF